MNRKKWKLGLKILATVAALAVVVIFVDFRKAAKGLAQADMLWFAGSILVLMLSIVPQSIRWRGMLRRPDIPLRKFAYFLFMGYFLNLFIPSQVGSDLVRSTAFGKRHGEVGLNIAVALAQRVIGLGLLLLFAAAGWWFYGGSIAGKIGWSLSAGKIATAAGLTILVIIAAWLARDRWRKSPVFLGLWDSLTDPSLVGWAIVHSFTIQVLTSVSTWMLFRAVFPSPDFWQITLFNSIVQVALLLPLSVGGVGVRDVLNLALYSGLGGMPTEKIVTVGLLGYSSLIFLALMGGSWMGFRAIVGRNQPASSED